MNNNFGKPLSSLPEVANGPRTTRTSSFWQDVAVHVSAHEGKWVEIDHPLKLSAAHIASNINRGYIAPLRGFRGASRSKRLYVALNPDNE